MVKTEEIKTFEQTTSEQREEIFREVYGVSRMSDILKNFGSDYDKCKNTSVSKIQDLYRDYSYAIFFMYSPSSIRNNLVKFKNKIHEHGGKYEEIASKCFTIGNIYAPIKKRDVERKVELKQALRDGESDSHNVEHVPLIRKKLTELRATLDNKTYKVSGNQQEAQVRAYLILAILGLSTGRRFTELLKTLKVSKRKDQIFFEGLLKGNDEKIEANIIELDYKEVQGYLRELRKWADTDDMTPSEINAKYAKVFNLALKRLGFLNVKTLRHNYCVAGSRIFRIDNETTEDTITRILGHAETLSSALNYT